VRRALVLGGGGVTGVAWEVGLIAGLAEAGVVLTGADVVIGTSAGAAVAAQVTSGTPVEDLFARQVAGPGSEIPAELGTGAVLRLVYGMVRHGRDPGAAGRYFGRHALAAGTIGEAERRRAIASRLPSHEWPQRPLRITAVDAVSGEFRAFEAADGVPLVDAVAASCAVPFVWPPVTIEGRRWIDGGMRSPVNADLAAGYDRVVVLAPIARGVGAAAPGRQVAALRAAGAEVVLVSPDAASRAAIGRNSLDPSRRGPAARAGRAQAPSAAAPVATAWG
jgi:NTE family protein